MLKPCYAVDRNSVPTDFLLITFRFCSRNYLGGVQALSRWFLPLYGKKTQQEKTHVSALPFSLPLALHSLGLLALLVLHRLVDGQDHASRFGSAGDRVLFDHNRLPHEVVVSVEDPNVNAINAEASPFEAAGMMLLAELVQDIRRVAAAVRGEGARDALQRPREVIDDNLLLAINAARILAQESRQLELNRTAARNNLLVLVRATHDHDSVVQRAIDLVDELLRSATDDNGDCLGLRAIDEEVIPFAA